MTEHLNYDPSIIEPKWQAKWESDQIYKSDKVGGMQKHYALTMLPYPSGDLHIGHWYAMTPSDARARFMRMRGYNVLFPMGFDSFGLPAENAAINRGIHPKEWTYANINKMRTQLHSMGAMFDWHREAISADPSYYKWTQWFFSQLYRHGKAYRKLAPVDWCPNCNTTLAREQVWGEDRHCERCDTPVIKKDLEQWFFRTTEYAEELLDFSHVDWPQRVRALQSNWIGRSEGARVIFHTETGDPFEVFTTRPDTLWGATFMVLAPEHALVSKITTEYQRNSVEEYIQYAIRQTDIQRESTDKDKTGVFTGGYAINPVNNERIPIWIADYVLITYGTGAIMAVPAHDERDFQFALKFGLPILPVIEKPNGLSKSYVKFSAVHESFIDELTKCKISFTTDAQGLLITILQTEINIFIEISKKCVKDDSWIEIVGATWDFIFADKLYKWRTVHDGKEILLRCQNINPDARRYSTVMEMLSAVEFYTDILYHDEYGTMINSGEFTGTEGVIARQKITKWLEEISAGGYSVNYKLRDWLISRQRYWGAPIPIVYCDRCGIVSVPDEELPVLLPEDVEWQPTGESPLKNHPTWVNATCPECGGYAKRETDTMDTFMCSSWYHLRYLSPHYDQWPFDPEEYDYWMPVDTYTGGIEHATMHLIYTRYFHKAGRDMGIMQGPEPMLQLRNQGIILGEDSEKMSKSRGNVVSPDILVEQYGADVVRAYLMFFARWELGAPWNSQGIEGTSRWIRRVWTLITDNVSEPVKMSIPDYSTLKNLRNKVHKSLAQITYDFENFEFNTIISTLMELLNEMYIARMEGAVGTQEWDEAQDIYLRMMAPVAPHITEELWSIVGKEYSIHTQKWPEVDQFAIIEDQFTLVIQVNGKVRERLSLPVGVSEAEVQRVAMECESVKKHLLGKNPRKIIYVPGKLINFVV